MTPKQFAIFLIIVVSQASVIRSDDQETLLDVTVKQVADDIAVKFAYAMDYLIENIILINHDATTEVKEDFRLDAKLNKADKIIERVKTRYGRVAIEHSARFQIIRETIISDTAAVGGVENPLVGGFISIITALEERLLTNINSVSGYVVDQVTLIAEDLENHISDEIIAQNIVNRQQIHNDLAVNLGVALTLDVLSKYEPVRRDLENQAVSSHTLAYVDEKIHGLIVTYFDGYIKAREYETNDFETLATIVSHII